MYESILVGDVRGHGVFMLKTSMAIDEEAIIASGKWPPVEVVVSCLRMFSDKT